MTRPSSPCPACAGPVPTSILGGEIVRERCPHCLPRRPFFRPAVEAALPDHRKRIKDALAKAFRVPAHLLDEPHPMIEGRKALEAAQEAFMRATLPPFFERFIPEAGITGKATGRIIVDEIGPPETCSTCDRRERLFESVPACALASPGTCRFALRRVE